MTTKLLMNSLFEFATTAALRWTIGLAVVVGLSACASRPGTETLIVRQEPSKPYQAITVITATDRQRDPTGVGYTAARSSRLQFERFTVAVPVTHKSPDEARSQIQTDPLKKYTVMGRQDITFKDINADKDILIYVHGYNYSFQESLFQAAKVASDGKLSEMPILFSWPSEGSVTGYVADKDAATYARDDLVQLLQDLKKRRTKSRVTLFGHSMGAWLVVEGLRQLKISGQEDVLQRIDQVVLAAPDIDVDLFKRQVDTIGPLARPMIVLSSTDDRALVISSRMGGSRTRIGSLDAADASVQKMIAGDIVKIVDLSALPAPDRTNHNRFIELINALAGSEIGRSTSLMGSLNKGIGLPVGEQLEKALERTPILLP
ncbi:alpha/beta fold hydrolase [Aquamicrobium defluvii]|uniref:alpha/beta hydrolase n=1 Tax=Aquamicrobium defluvii TaxID=69279 RepID=UPI0018DB6288